MEQLPPEIFSLILEKLDFDTLQKSCVLVSKTWFGFIRNYKKLSDSVALTEGIPKNENLTRYVQKNWPILSKLSINSNYSIISQIDVELLPNLSIINMKTTVHLCEENADVAWLIVEKMNFTPKNAIQSIDMAKKISKIETISNFVYKDITRIAINPAKGFIRTV